MHYHCKFHYTPTPSLASLHYVNPVSSYNPFAAHSSIVSSSSMPPTLTSSSHFIPSLSADLHSHSMSTHAHPTPLYTVLTIDPIIYTYTLSPSIIVHVKPLR